MSLESARKFIEKLESDAEFRDRVMQFIGSEGFSCTLDEARVAVHEVLKRDASRFNVYKHKDCVYLSNPLGYKKCLYSSIPHEHKPQKG